MNRMRAFQTIVLVSLLVTVAVKGAEPDKDPSGVAVDPAVMETNEEKKWEFSISAYAYFVPDDREYVQPTIIADRDWLHLEARYNYEALDTGSAWIGYNFSGGKKFEWEFTPMIGGVFGETDGVGPGYKGSIRWRRFELYSEGEYVIDVGNSSESFFYNWSELTFAPVEWFRFGFVTQRTRAYKSDVDIQRGFLAGFTYRKIDLAIYVFNPDESRPTIVTSVALTF
jgi:hypothetical protein